MTSLTVPITTIDCHAHVMRCDAPLAPDRHSAPKRDCTVDEYLGVLDANGVSHGVLTAPSVREKLAVPGVGNIGQCGTADPVESNAHRAAIAHCCERCAVDAGVDDGGPAQPPRDAVERVEQ